MEWAKKSYCPSLMRGRSELPRERTILLMNNLQAQTTTTSQPSTLLLGGGRRDVIEAIVGHRVGVNARDDDGFTALHTAALYDPGGCR